MTKIAGTIATSTSRAVVSRSPRRARAVDDERRQRDDQQHLAELGGLHLEERQLDRAPRAARDAAEHRDEQDAGHHQPVDAVLQLAQARVVDPAQDDRERACRSAKNTPWRVT